MKDSNGRLADYIAMATLCRRLAEALQAVSPERLDQVMVHATKEAERTLAVKVSNNPDESDLLRAAARSEITFVQAIYNWVRPRFPVRTDDTPTRKKAKQVA